MKLDKYIELLQDIMKEHGNLECIYAQDDEGNGFFPVIYPPSTGNYDREEFEFISSLNFGEEDYDEDLTVNAVCVN